MTNKKYLAILYTMTNDIPEDDALWAAEMEATHKLGRKERVSHNVIPQERSEFAGEKKHIPPQQVRGDSFPYLELNDTTGLDRNLANNLRKGKVAVEGKLDLHGFIQEKAQPKLMDFILEAYSAGKRCVLVVTGKGSRSESGVGVLQEAVPRWLNAPDIRPCILAYCHAQPKDGGSGALYVLLKRHRNLNE